MSAHTPTLSVVEVRADDTAALDATYEIERAATRYDVPDLPPPCRYRHHALLRTPWPGERTLHWLVREGDRPVGYVYVSLPTLDNLDNAEVDIIVHPDHRRRGIGRALHARVVDAIRAEGRKRLMAFTVRTLPGEPDREGPGTRFAAAMGMSDALDDVRRRLDLATVDEAELDRLLAGAWTRAAGYSVVSWVGSVPEEYLADVAMLEGRLIEDAPMGDLILEPEKYDADRMRQMDVARAAHGGRAFGAGARHDATGRLVAYTVLIVRRSVPYHAWQGTTLVAPAHRGHRLGMIVKIENLRFARQHLPALREIDTWNAAVNDHMISINEAMGFQVADRWASWQQDI